MSLIKIFPTETSFGLHLLWNIELYKRFWMKGLVHTMARSECQQTAEGEEISLTQAFYN